MLKLFKAQLVYESEANQQVFQTLCAIPRKARHATSFPKALSLLGHIEAIRHVWLYRIDSTSVNKPTGFLFEGWSLSRLQTYMHLIDNQWSAYFQQLKPQALFQYVSFPTENGQTMECRLIDIFEHLLTHGCYHRGQIALLIRQMGGTPMATDRIQWLQRPCYTL